MMNWRHLAAAPRGSRQSIVPICSTALKGASRCPLWIKSRHFAMQSICPLYSRKRTFAVQLGMSALGQKRTSLSLFDHFIGCVEQRRRHGEAKRFRGLEVDYQLELDGGLDGKLTWFRALEDAISIRRRTPVLIENIRAVRDQAAD